MPLNTATGRRTPPPDPYTPGRDPLRVGVPLISRPETAKGGETEVAPPFEGIIRGSPSKRLYVSPNVLVNRPTDP